MEAETCSASPVSPGKVMTSTVEGTDAKAAFTGASKNSRSQNHSNRSQRRRGATADSATQEDQCHPRKIFIGGLAHKTTTQFLRDYFSKYGPIVDAVVLRWPDGRSRGFGYVTFSEAQGAWAALQESHQVGGRQVDVKRAVPGTNKLFVGGLPQNTTAIELREHFEAYGIVSDAVVMIDPTTNRSRGFGFVCFLPGQEGAASAQYALEQYQNHRIRGKWIEVKSAAPPHKLAKDGSTSPPGGANSELGFMTVDPDASDTPSSKGAQVMSLAAALNAPTSKVLANAGPQVNERPVASPQHRRQGGIRGFHAGASQQPQPQKVSLPGAVGTPPGLGATAAAAAAAMSAFNIPAPGLSLPSQDTGSFDAETPPGFGWPTASSGAEVWTSPSCLSLSNALSDLPQWKADSHSSVSEKTPSSADRNSMFSSSNDLQRSLAELIRLRTTECL